MTSTLPGKVRIPGRQRFAGVFSGDTPTLLALFAIGLLVSAFYKLPWWREILLGPSGNGAVDSSALPAMVLLLAALASRSLLRQGFRWMDASELTWLELDRAPVMAARLWRVWLGWLLAIAYAGLLGAAINGVPAEMWIAVGALVFGSLSLTLVLARRTRDFTAELTPLALATIGLVVATVGLPPRWLIGLGGLMTIAALVLVWGTGSPMRPVAATLAGRAELVEGWRERVVRVIAVSFLEPMMLLPSARPVAGSVRTVLRLAWLGVRGRARYFSLSVLLAMAVAVARLAFPALPDVVLVAVAAYAALMPFGGGLGELWRNPGLRRWVAGRDLELRGAYALVFAGLTAVWALLLFAVATLLGVGFSAAAWVAVPLATASVLRTAARPPIDYALQGVADMPWGQAPTGLVRQAVRGPDLGLLGVTVLALAPFGVLPLVVAVVLTVWCCLR